ncbi:hypothetical protein WG66_006047 [Moniliophthora roreri]|nr:hypothetical protein WG66_006047 [Moniliophthora roreri]
MFQGNSGFNIMGGQFYNVWGNVQAIAVPAELPVGSEVCRLTLHNIYSNETYNLVQSVRRYLEVLFDCREEVISNMLIEFIREGQYSLSIDEGRQVIILGSEEEQWARVVPGTRIVMSVILWQKKKRFSSGYECPICKTWNSSQEPELNMAGDCCNPKCPGRFQAFEEDQDYSGASSNETQNKDRNINMLQNLHIMQSTTNCPGLDSDSQESITDCPGLDSNSQEAVSVPAICDNRASLTALEFDFDSQAVSVPAICNNKTLLNVLDLILTLSG